MWFLVRTASLANARTKEKLGEIFEEDPEMIDKLMSDWAGAVEQLKAMILTMDTAYLRVLSGASMRAISNRKAKRRKA
jgi:hypothetical protein